MPLEIRQREREGIQILDLQGRITAGADAGELREELRTRIAAKQLNLILNMEGVEYIDSTGLGALVMCFTGLRKAGGQLKLCCLSRRNIELLVYTKLTTVFEIFGSLQDAVNSFFPERKITHFDILSFVQQQEREDEQD